ncbi:MAG: hypothetical protein SV062_08045 [Thermodesulfobacteriota bacterium]|nr:hypothetical protein [Thermodesulfobacteriota bacterium]
MAFSDMKQELLLKCPGLSDPQLGSLINTSYKKLAKRWQWAGMKYDFQLATKASESTGGVHFTNGSTSVTAATSVSAAWTSSTSWAFDAMLIKKENEPDYYTITGAITTAAAATYSAITLTSEYLGKTTTAAASSGDDYIIFQNIYSISSNCETILSATYQDRLLEIDSISADKIDPDWSTTGEPEKILDFGTLINTADYSWNRQIKVIPIPDDIYPIKFTGYRRVEKLSSDNDRAYIDEDLIVCFATVEGLRTKRIYNQNSVWQTTLNDAIVESEKMLKEMIHRDMQIQHTKKYVTHAEEIEDNHNWEWHLSHDSGGSGLL